MAEIVKTVVFYDRSEMVYIEKFSVPTEDFDLKRAITNVAMEYHLTEEGRSSSHWKEYCKYDYSEFYEYSLEKLCPKHGFHKIRRIENFMEIDINDELLDMDEQVVISEALYKMYIMEKYSGIQPHEQKSGIRFHPKPSISFDPQDDALPNQEEKENMNCMEALEESAKNPATQKKIYEIAVQFARKWGVMEILDGALPNQGTEENMNCMIAWATEFVNSNETDSVDFFERKMNEVKRKEAKTEQTDN